VTTLQSKTSVGNQTYTIIDCLNNMKGAFSKDEALRWGFYIQKSFIQNGYNKDIEKAMNDILAFHGVPPIMALPDERHDGDSGMPPTLINYIFKTEFNQEKLKHLWRWVKESLIDNICYPYQYLSLLLFLENHHSVFLQKPHINNTDLKNQMEAWFPEAKVKCSSDALGTYRNGYFDSEKFSYVSWLNSNGEPPIGYNSKKDQSLMGFQALNKFCNDLELNLSGLKI
jgi:hypothetical protein